MTSIPSKEEKDKQGGKVAKTPSIKWDKKWLEGGKGTLFCCIGLLLSAFLFFPALVCSILVNYFVVALGFSLLVFVVTILSKDNKIIRNVTMRVSIVMMVILIILGFFGKLGFFSYNPYAPKSPPSHTTTTANILPISDAEVKEIVTVTLKKEEVTEKFFGEAKGDWKARYNYDLYTVMFQQGDKPWQSLRCPRNTVDISKPIRLKADSDCEVDFKFY